MSGLARGHQLMQMDKPELLAVLALENRVRDVLIRDTHRDTQ